MNEDFVLNAELRDDIGKGASRRLRHANKVPAIVYGGDQDPVKITLDHNDVILQLDNEAFYSHVLTLKLDGKEQQTVLRDVQRHPFKQRVLHLDFLRVSKDKAIHVHVPLHFLNEEKCVGVKTGGGLLSKALTEVEVSCLPKDLPEYIEVDVLGLELGASIHLSEISMPTGVALLALSHDADHDTAVVSVYKPRGSSEDDEAPTPSEGDAAAEGDASAGDS